MASGDYICPNCYNWAVDCICRSQDVTLVKGQVNELEFARNEARQEMWSAIGKSYKALLYTKERLEQRVAELENELRHSQTQYLLSKYGEAK